MASIHPAPFLVFVFDDGEGGKSLRIQASDGSIQELPLTVDSALRLSRDLLNAGREMVLATQKRPQ